MINDYHQAIYNASEMELFRFWTPVMYERQERKEEKLKFWNRDGNKKYNELVSVLANSRYHGNYLRGSFYSKLFKQTNTEKYYDIRGHDFLKLNG